MSNFDSKSNISFGWRDGQSNWGALLNRGLRSIAYGGYQLSVINELASPPASPTNSDKYIVGASPTGDWFNFTEGDVAVWGYSDSTATNLSWQRLSPITGWRAYNENTNRLMVWNGVEWEDIIGQAAAGTLTEVATDTTIDGDGTATDPLSVNLAQVQVQADWDSTDMANAAFIKNKPTIPTVPPPQLPLWGQRTDSFTGNIGGPKPAGFQYNTFFFRVGEFRLNQHLSDVYYQIGRQAGFRNGRRIDPLPGIYNQVGAWFRILFPGDFLTRNDVEFNCVLYELDTPGIQVPPPIGESGWSLENYDRFVLATDPSTRNFVTSFAAEFHMRTTSNSPIPYAFDVQVWAGVFPRQETPKQTSFQRLTQSAYDALTVKDDSVLYLVTDQTPKRIYNGAERIV